MMSARRTGLLRSIALHGALFAVVFVATLLYRLQSSESSDLSPERDARRPAITSRPAAGTAWDTAATSVPSTRAAEERESAGRDPAGPDAAVAPGADVHIPAPPVHEVYVPPPDSPPMSQAAIAALNAHLPDGATPPQDPIPAEYLDP